MHRRNTFVALPAWYAVCAGIAMAMIAPAWAKAAIGEWETSVRHAIAWQVALDNIGFSPGLIDGQPGTKTRLATREFQRVRGLPVTGELDEATAKALDVTPETVLGRYTIEAADLEEIGPVPQSWVARSKLKRLGHEALEDVICEKFHCTRALLASLNRGKQINQLKRGDQVVVPRLDPREDWPNAAFLEVNFAEKTIRAIGTDKKLTALFHCSIAASKSKLPSRDATVVVTAPNPIYTFDPKMWPEVKEKVSSKLEIPPGPRNPVGRFWIGLSLDGYGMHGTPNPELIGKTGSHGCFRLANWDAIRLGRMVRVGTPVKFVNRSSGDEKGSEPVRKAETDNKIKTSSPSLHGSSPAKK